MKKCLSLFVFTSLLLLSQLSYSQSPTSVHLNAYQYDESKDLVLVSITTTESFIIGANRYVLHIGGKYFERSLHPEGHLNEIVFYIPMADYNQLVAGAEIFLVYGFYHENTKLDQEGSKDVAVMGKHWRLGSFTPKSFN